MHKLSRKNVWAVYLVAALLSMASPQCAWGQSDSVRTTVIDLTQYGFEPSAISVKPGANIFVLRSRLAGSPQFDMTEVGSAKGQKTFQIRDKLRTSQRITLTPGTYEIRDSRFSQWKCIVTVEP